MTTLAASSADTPDAHDVDEAPDTPDGPKRRGLKHALALSGGGTIGARFLGALGGLLAARLLGPAGRGELALVVFLATAASTAVSAGIQFWTARETARTGGVRLASWIVRVHLVVLTVVCLGVGLLLTAGVALTGWSAVLVWLGVGIAVSNTFQAVLIALPTGVRAMGVFAAVVMLAGLVYAGTNAVLLAVGEASLSWVLVGMIAGNLLSLVVILVWLRRAPQGTGAVEQGRAAYARALRFGLPAGLGELLLFAMLRIDVVVVAMFLPLRDVGFYAVATSLAEMLWVIPDSVSIVVLPTTSSAPAESHTTRLLDVSVVVTFVAGAILSIVAGPLTRGLFGGSFASAADAVPVLALASVAGAVWKIVGAEVVALGHTRPRLTSAVAGLATMVAVDVVAVPAFGIVGAALGSAVAYAVAGAVVTRCWSTVTGRPVAELLGLRRPVPAVEPRP